MRKNLRILLFTLTLLLGSSLLFGSNEPCKLTVFYKNGTQRAFLFSNKPSVSFLSGEVVFAVPGTVPVQVGFDAIDHMAFEQGDVTVYAPSKPSAPGGTQVIIISENPQQDPDPGPVIPDPQPTLINLSDVTVTLAETSFAYTGSAIEPPLTIQYQGATLTQNVDYTVTYSPGNVEPGEVTMTITGKGNYTGSVTKTFSITQNRHVTAQINNQAVEPVFTTLLGNVVEALFETQEGRIKVNNCFAKSGTEIYISVTPNSGYTISKADITPELTGNDPENLGKFREYTYVMPVSGEIHIEAMFSEHHDLSDAELALVDQQQTFVYTGDSIQPACTLTLNGQPLVEGTDYTIGYQNNVNAGTATITAMSMGHFSGTVTKTFEITKAPLTVKADTQTTTYGEEIPILTYEIAGFVGDDADSCLSKQPVIVTEAAANSPVGEYAITVDGAEADNYVFTYVDATLYVSKALLTVKADTLTKVYGDENPALIYTVTGFVGDEDATVLTQQPEVATEATADSSVGVYAITLTGGVAVNYDFDYVPATLTVTPRSLADATLTMAADSLAYTGQPVLPELTVQHGSVVLTVGEDYQVTASDNTEVGTATLTIEGQGNYDGRIDTTFVVYLKPSLRVVINDELITPVIDELFNNSAPATFESEQGVIEVDNLYATTGNTVVLTVTPKRPYYIFKEDISGIDLIGSNPADSMAQRRYRYVVPEEGEVAIEAVFSVDSIALGIGNHMAGALRFEVVDGKTVRVLGARKTAPVSIFDARGQLVAAEVARSERELMVRLANQPQGLYIIKVNNNTFKVYRK